MGSEVLISGSRILEVRSLVQDALWSGVATMGKSGRYHGCFNSVDIKTYMIAPLSAMSGAVAHTTTQVTPLPLSRCLDSDKIFLIFNFFTILFFYNTILESYK